MTQQAFKKIPAEMTNFEQFQLEKYGNILATAEATPEGDLFESGLEELNRLSEWIDMQAEQQLTESQF